MLEKDFQTSFGKWLKHTNTLGAFELKLTKIKSINFNAVKQHQLLALKMVKQCGLYHKLSDFSPEQKPFDCFNLKGCAYVVVMFYTRGTKHFYMIDIDEWINETLHSERRSLTESRAAEIGTMGVLA